MKDVVKPLEFVLDSGKPILIVANEIDNEALQSLVLNRVKGNLKVCAIKSPGFGNGRLEMLKDLATLTGAKIYHDDSEISEFKSDHLGNCKKIIVSRNDTLFVANESNKQDVLQRIDSLNNFLEDPGLDDDERKFISARITQLSGGIAILRVGAATEAEMIERRDRVDDALHATRAALQEGIVPGGGVSLAKASQILKVDSSSGASIIRQACLDPIRQIVKNAGRSSDLIVEKINENDSNNFGYDARNDSYGDMFELGVIDPLKVVRCALQNASSAASLLLTSECAMVEEIENN
jgi:chaperonin GroEL